MYWVTIVEMGFNDHICWAYSSDPSYKFIVKYKQQNLMYSSYRYQGIYYVYVFNPKRIYFSI